MTIKSRECWWNLKQPASQSSSPLQYVLYTSRWLRWLRLFSLFGVFLCLTICLVSVAWADDRVNPIEDQIDTGSTSPLLTNETPGMVIVLTYQQIRARGYRSVYEILRDLPGFSTRGGFGEGFVNITIDGDIAQNNEKFLIYVDGVLEQDLWRRSTWLTYQYSVYFIKNITIFYGPAATRFGANAMSGIIFIDTKKAEDLADGYGEISFTKDVRNNSWAVDMMVGHSYTKRIYPKLALSLFSWYFRGRLYYSDERNADYDALWKPDNWTNPNNPQYARFARILEESNSFLNRALQRYRQDIYNAYRENGAFKSLNDPTLDSFVEQYRQRLLNSYLNDPSNSGLYANPSYRNQNLSFSGEAGFRFENWFLRFYLWSTGAGQGLQFLPTYVQTRGQWWVRNFSLSLHRLKSELWSSGVGEKAQVIYFNLNMVFQRHEIPGNSLTVNFIPQTTILRDPISVGGTSYQPRCRDVPGGSNVIDCTVQEYGWRPKYTYVVSNSFRAEPKLDFRLLNGHLSMSIGVNAGVAFLQGASVTSTREEPEIFGDPSQDRGAGNHYEHLYLTGFLQSEIKFTDWLYANIGLRSDWELVRGRLEIVPNCDRSVLPCYRFSAPIIGRASIITRFWEGKLRTRLSYGYAFLSPSNWELFGEASGEVTTDTARGALDRSLDARGLLPQDKHSVEFNIYANVASRLFFTFSVFHHWLNNVTSLVDLVYRQNETRNLSIGNQTTWGGRFHAIVRVFEWMNISANVTVLYPRLYAFDLVNEAQNPIHLRQFPIFQSNILVDFRSHPYDLSHFFGSIRVNFTSGRSTSTLEQLQDGSIQLSANQASTNFSAIIHLSAGYLWRPPESWVFPRFISASATVENLLNSAYNDLGIRTALGPIYSPIVPQPGINGYFNLSLGF